MSINIVRLRSLLEAASYNEDLEGPIVDYSNNRSHERTDLINSAVNALPELLKIAEAAVEWAKWGRDDSDDEHELLKAVREAFV